MSTFMRWEAIEQLEIFGGKTTLERVRVLIYDVVLRGQKTAHAALLPRNRAGRPVRGR